MISYSTETYQIPTYKLAENSISPKIGPTTFVQTLIFICSCIMLKKELTKILIVSAHNLYKTKINFLHFFRIVKCEIVAKMIISISQKNSMCNLSLRLELRWFWYWSCSHGLREWLDQIQIISAQNLWTIMQTWQTANFFLSNFCSKIGFGCVLEDFYRTIS